MGIHSWIFILTDIHCRMYLHGYPSSDINVDIVRLHDLLSLSPVNSVFFRSLRSAICNPKRSHWMGMLRITNGGPERSRKRSVGKREGKSCKHRIHTCMYNWRLTSKNHRYLWWYSWIFGNPCMDMLWILGRGQSFLYWKTTLTAMTL